MDTTEAPETVIASAPLSATDATSATYAENTEDSLAAAVAMVPPTEVKSDSAEQNDIDLDFLEEISDGELEEEARIRGLGDALGVDWASLVEESKAISKAKSSTQLDTSAKQRWLPHRILLDVGVSFRMAGKDYATNILSAAHKKLLKELAKEKEFDTMKGEFTVKKEEDKEGAQGDSNPMLAEETKQLDVKVIKQEPVEELLIHPIACVQVASKANAEARKNLVFNATGPYCRALCARRDIEMRRKLCGLPAGGNYNCCLVVAKKPTNETRYATLAKQLFEKALAKAN